MNVAILSGKIKYEPKTVTTANDSICMFMTITVKDVVNLKAGVKNTLFTDFDMSLFGRIVDVAKSLNIKKDDNVIVKGKLSTRKTKDKNGFESRKTSIVLDSIELLKNETGSDSNTVDDEFNF